MTENTIVRFFSWWKQGLMSPLENVLPKAKASPTVLSVVGADLLDSRAKKLGEPEIGELKNSDGIYLLAPESKVMSRRVADSQRGLPLTQIAEEVLPFGSNELFFATDAGQETIHTIVRSELSSQLGVIEGYGLEVIGVAFSIDDELIYSDHLDEKLVEGRPAAKSSWPKIWPISALLIFSSLIAVVIFLSYLEKRKQSVLSDELAQLQRQLNVNQHTIEGSLNDQVEIRSAAELQTTLKSVANSLTETTQLDQLILTSDELVLDASASSATQVQANLDESDEFISSEFVTSISRSSGDELERFRLKLQLNGGR